MKIHRVDFLAPEGKWLRYHCARIKIKPLQVAMEDVRTEQGNAEMEVTVYGLPAYTVATINPPAWWMTKGQKGTPHV